MLEYKIYDRATDDSKNIRFTVFCDEQGVLREREIDEYDEPGMAKHIVIYNDSKPVATSRFYKENNGRWHAGRIAVLKEMRGTGCGRKVLEFAEEEMKKFGAEKIFISAQVQAKGFYEALGYKAYGDIYPEENIPHTAMEKIL